MQSQFAGFYLFLSAILTAAAPAAGANVPRGAQLAQQWCASCHVIGGKPPAAIQQGPPSFHTIAQGPLTADQLHAFLSHPHGAMPDLALSRSEIDDLIGYIGTQR